MKFLLGKLGAALLLSFAGGASAATISGGSHDFDYQFAYSGSGLIGGADGSVLPFAFFDGALGTLGGVRFVMHSVNRAEIHVGATNLSPQDNMAVQGLYSGDIFVDLVDPALPYGSLYNALTSLSAGCDTGAPGSCSAQDSTLQTIDFVIDVDAGFLPLFVGSGTYGIALNVGGQLFAEVITSFSGPGDGSGSGQWAGNLGVEYVYAAVPEPAAGVLAALGLTALAAGRRRAVAQKV